MISICISTYEQKGHGAKMLTQLLVSIKKQRTDYPFEIVISDNAADGSIKQVADKFTDLPIKYHFNPQRGASENINNAIDLASYDLIKLMMMDDVFMLHSSLDLFVEALKNNGWVISNSFAIKETGVAVRKMTAKYEHGKFDKNMVGMPSVVGFRKSDIRFDTRLKTFCDLFFYYQLYELYGKPGLITQHCIGQRYWQHSLSHNQPPSHAQDREFLIRNHIKNKNYKIVVAVVVYNRVDNIERWKSVWSQCETGNAELVIINNGDQFIDGAIKRENNGYDIGAFQDVCKERLAGFLNDWNYLLWCTDDTIPMTKDFIYQFISKMSHDVGCACMHISDEYIKHVRTTGFCITKDVSKKLIFPADPVTTKEHCLLFEHKGGRLTLLSQVRRMGKRVVQVAPLNVSPLYDMNFWYRNKKAKLQAAGNDRMNEHNQIFNSV